MRFVGLLPVWYERTFYLDLRPIAAEVKAKLAKIIHE
jgi:hypothetical protein